MNEQIVILDFGSQFTQVIARRIRECNVYSVILRHDTPAKKIAAMEPKGIILSGGPSSVYAKGAPLPDKEIFNLGIPILGICFGLWKLLSVKVSKWYCSIIQTYPAQIQYKSMIAMTLNKWDSFSIRLE